MIELYEWLNENRISYKKIDKETLEIEEFGKAYIQDMSLVGSIFKTGNTDKTEFNCLEHPKALLNEGIKYVIFPFGDNWYYTDIEKDFAFNILKYVGKRKSCKSSVEYVNLGVHTPFELLNGSFMPEEWVKKAKYLGHKAIGVCDMNTMASQFILQKACKGAGITPVFGYSLTFKVGTNKVGAKVYCQSQEGLRGMLRIQKEIMVDSDDKMIDLYTLCEYGKGNVLVFDKFSAQWIHGNSDIVDYISKHFNALYFQVDFSEFKAERIDIKILKAQKYYFDNVYDDQRIFPVLLCDNYYLDADDAKNKILLNKIASGAAHDQSDDQYYKDIDEHYERFCEIFSDDWDVDTVFEECCESTLIIAENAKALYETSVNFMPEYDMTPEEEKKYGNTHTMFLELLEDGLRELVPEHDHERYRKQMEYEIYVIESTNNIDYLLVQWDTCNWARQNGIMVGCGRGSAAGCLLLYLLKITMIDPLKYDLIFERFLLPERSGLEASKTTIIGQDVQASEYIEVTLENNKTYKIDKDAQLLVNRKDNEKPIVIYADELEEDDDIIFDNRDLLFTLKEI